MAENLSRLVAGMAEFIPQPVTMAWQTMADAYEQLPIWIGQIIESTWMNPPAAHSAKPDAGSADLAERGEGRQFTASHRDIDIGSPCRLPGSPEEPIDSAAGAQKPSCIETLPREVSTEYNTLVCS